MSEPETPAAEQTPGTPETPETPATPAAEPATPAVAGEVPKEERTMGMVAHLAALAGFTGIPGASILGPLIVWLMKKDTMPFVDQEGKEAVNFQLTVFIAMLVCSPLVCVGVGLIVLPAIGIVALVFTIIAALKANEGEHYRYPLTIRLIK